MIQINKKQMQVLFKKVIVITFIYSFLIVNSFFPVFSSIIIKPTCNGSQVGCPSGTSRTSSTSSTSSNSSTTGGICQIAQSYCLNGQKLCCNGAQPTCPGGFFTCTKTPRGSFLECCINSNCTSQNVVCGSSSTTSSTSSGSGCINCLQVLPDCQSGEILVPQTCNKCAHCIPSSTSSTSSTTGGICQIAQSYCLNGQKLCCNGAQPTCPGGFFTCTKTPRGSFLECCINGNCSSQNVVCGSSTTTSSTSGCINCLQVLPVCQPGEILVPQTCNKCAHCVPSSTSSTSSGSTGSPICKFAKGYCLNGQGFCCNGAQPTCPGGFSLCASTSKGSILECCTNGDCSSQKVVCDSPTTSTSSSSSSSSGGPSCIICPAIQPNCGPGEILIPQSCSQCAHCKPDPGIVNPVCEISPAFCSNGSRLCCNGAQPACPGGFFTCTPTPKGSILECCINGNCTPQNVVCNSN